LTLLTSGAWVLATGLALTSCSDSPRLGDAGDRTPATRATTNAPDLAPPAARGLEPCPGSPDHRFSLGLRGDRATGLRRGAGRRVVILTHQSRGTPCDLAALTVERKDLNDETTTPPSVADRQVDSVRLSVLGNFVDNLTLGSFNSYAVNFVHGKVDLDQFTMAIDQGAGFITVHCRCQNRQHHAGFAGGCSAVNFRDGAAKQASGARIERSDSRGNGFAHTPAQVGERRGDPSTERGFQLSAKSWRNHRSKEGIPYKCTVCQTGGRG